MIFLAAFVAAFCTGWVIAAVITPMAAYGAFHGAKKSPADDVLTGLPQIPQIVRDLC